MQSANMRVTQRVAVLVLIVANAALVLAGQLLISFQVNFKPIALAAHTTFRYNLWEGASELHRANMRYLALLVVVWSGVWPYVKLLCLAVVVMLPIPLSSTVPSTVVAVCGVLGRFSFMDLCVVLSVVVALSFDSMMGWAQAEAMEGAFVLTLALVSSQCIGHYISSFCAPPRSHVPTCPRLAAHPRWIAWGLLVVCVVQFLLFVVSHLLVVYEADYFFRVLGARVKIADVQGAVMAGWGSIWGNGHLDGANHALGVVGLVLVSIVPCLASLTTIALLATTLLSASSSSSSSAPAPPPRSLAASRLYTARKWLSRWALFDVFVLGLCVVVGEIHHIGEKLTDKLVTEVHVRKEMWVLVAAALLQWLCSWGVRVVVVIKTDGEMTEVRRLLGGGDGGEDDEPHQGEELRQGEESLRGGMRVASRAE